jgi:Papain family cysteine protease
MLLTLAIGILPAVSAAQPASATPTTFSDWLNEAAKAASSCPTVEIAPDVFIPICLEGLPKPPADMIVPEVVQASVTDLPAGVDLRRERLDGPVKNQLQAGVCYAFALTTVLESSLRRQGHDEVLSPLHVIAADSFHDLWRAHPSEAIVTEAGWPYDPRKACKFERGRDACERAYGVRTQSWQSEPALVAERERQRSRGVAFVGRASVLKRSPVDQIASALAARHAVWASIAIDRNAWGSRGVRGGVLPEYGNADRGSHAVAVVGYREAGSGRQFLLHNSWGARWGEGGYAWISDRSLRAHLVDAYLVDATPAKARPTTGSGTSPSGDSPASRDRRRASAR